QVVQPVQPVRAGYREHAAVGAVHEADLVVEQPLLADRIAVVGRDRGVRAGRIEVGHPDHWVAPAQAAHSPNSATWPTSTRKPRLDSRAPTRPSRTDGDTSATPPHALHTRCTCWSSLTAWYVGAPCDRWACVTSPSSSSSSRVRYTVVMLIPAAVLATAACTWSGVAWPSRYTASRTSWRCAVSRSPRARST